MVFLKQLREVRSWTLQQRQKFRREIVGFALAGGISLVVDLAVFVFLVFLETSLSFANASATISALFINFLINHRTFLPDRSFRHGLTKKSLRFSAVATASAVLLFVGFEIALRTLPDQTALTYSLVRVVIIGSGAAIRFALLRSWVFSPAAH